MTQNFVVLGYPNSRLAWLSVFLSTQSALCQAEVNRLMWDVSDLSQLLEGDHYSHLGVADSALGVFAAEIHENICQRILVIERNPEDIERIEHASGIPVNNFVRLMEESLEQIRGREGVLFVPFEGLRDRKVMEKAFWHCLPGLGFDELRWESVSEMYIEMDPILLSIHLKDHDKRIKRLFRTVFPKLLVQAEHEGRAH